MRYVYDVLLEVRYIYYRGSCESNVTSACNVKKDSEKGVNWVWCINLRKLHSFRRGFEQYRQYIGIFSGGSHITKGSYRKHQLCESILLSKHQVLYTIISIILETISSFFLERQMQGLDALKKYFNHKMMHLCL